MAPSHSRTYRSLRPVSAAIPALEAGPIRAIASKSPTRRPTSTMTVTAAPSKWRTTSWVNAFALDVSNAGSGAVMVSSPGFCLARPVRSPAVSIEHGRTAQRCEPVATLLSVRGDSEGASTAPSESRSGFLLDGREDPLGQKRDAPHPRAGRGEDGVGQRRRDGRDAGLADPGRELGARDHVHLDDVGQLVHAEHLVVVEVGLDQVAVGDRAALLQRIAQAEEERALDLGTDAVGVDDDAAVHRADDLLDAHAPGGGVDPRLDDRGRPRRRLLLLRGDAGHPEPRVGRERLAPAGPLGHE